MGAGRPAGRRRDARTRRAPMSEYQYYEFLAVDRPLTEPEMRELRAVSSRAVITPTRFTNHYEWGDFKGDPRAWMEEYFDAFLYFANWGTHELMLRLPRRVLEPATARRYCRGDVTSARVKGGHVILEFLSEAEGGDWYEGEDEDGSLSALVPLRADLAAGDLRALYLGWLLCVQAGELDHGGAQARVAGFRDPLLALGPAAPPRARRQAGVGGERPSVLEAAEQRLEPEQRAKLGPDPLEPGEGGGRRRRLVVRRRADRRVTLTLDRGHPRGDQLDPLDLPTDLRLEPLRRGTPVPGPERVETGQAILAQRVVVGDPLAGEQPFDPVRVPGPLLEQRAALTCQAATVLLLRARRPHRRADAPGGGGPSPRAQAIGVRTSSSPSIVSVLSGGAAGRPRSRPD